MEDAGVDADLVVALLSMGGEATRCVWKDNAYLFGTRPIELLEGGDNASFLACARGTVDEEVGKFAAVCLGRHQYV